MAEVTEAIETNQDGRIYVSKSSSAPSQPSYETKLGARNDEVHIDHVDGPLNEDDANSLELVTVVGEGKKGWKQQLCTKRMIGCWLVGLVILVLAIVLPLVLNDSRNNIDVSDGSGESDEVSFVSGGDDSQLSSTVAYQVLQALVSDPNALLDPNEPQGQAFLAVAPLDDPFEIQQQYALKTIYYSTEGDRWVFNYGWSSIGSRERSSMDSPCEMAGISICRNSGEGKKTVAGLDLDSNNLQGSLPDDMCLLTSLERVSVANNNLEYLPSCLASLSTLDVLKVEGNPNLLESAINEDSLFCANGRSWDILTTDCHEACDCCTSCS